MFGLWTHRKALSSHLMDVQYNRNVSSYGRTIQPLALISMNPLLCCAKECSLGLSSIRVLIDLHPAVNIYPRQRVSSAMSTAI